MNSIEFNEKTNPLDPKYVNIIFDMDDTLCECSKFYIEKYEEFAKFQKSLRPDQYSKDFILELAKTIDVQFAKHDPEFSANRFPASLGATSYVLDVMSNDVVNHVNAMTSRNIGQEVYDASYPLYDGVYEFLTHLKSLKYNLFLYTKGDDDIQRRKIEINKLDEIFPNENIHIVTKKNKDTLSEIFTNHFLSRENTLVIGDSLRDEISAAISLGVDTVHVTSGKPSWDYDKDLDHSPEFTISKVTDLSQYLPDLSII